MKSSENESGFPFGRLAKIVHFHIASNFEFLSLSISLENESRFFQISFGILYYPQCRKHKWRVPGTVHLVLGSHLGRTRMGYMRNAESQQLDCKFRDTFGSHGHIMRATTPRPMHMSKVLHMVLE